MQTANLINGLAAFAALVTAAAALWQAKRLKTSLQVETLGGLLDRFESEGYEEKRKAAATSCLANIETRNPAVDVEDVLDFFEDVGFFVRIGVLTDEMAWHGFYHWIRGYYQASERYIAERRNNEPAAYDELHRLYPRLNGLAGC